MAEVGAKRREERVKLLATALSNLGVASIVTGVISPLTAAHVHVVVALAAFVGGIALHLIAQVVLHLVVRSREGEP